MTWVPPPAILGACLVVLVLFIAALSLIIHRNMTDTASEDAGDRLRDALNADMELLEGVVRIAQREILMGHPRAQQLREKALAFSAGVDDDLAKLGEYFRTAIANAPQPSDGLPGTLADEGLSLRFSALVATTRMLARGLEKCDDIDSGVARLRRSVDEVLDCANVAVVACEAAAARGRA